MFGGQRITRRVRRGEAESVGGGYACGHLTGLLRMLDFYPKGFEEINEGFRAEEHVQMRVFKISDCNVHN